MDASSTHHALRGRHRLSAHLAAIDPVEIEGLGLLALIPHRSHAQANSLWLGEFWRWIGGFEHLLQIGFRFGTLTMCL
jgi:hypothetical protein